MARGFVYNNISHEATTGLLRKRNDLGVNKMVEHELFF